LFTLSVLIRYVHWRTAKRALRVDYEDSAQYCESASNLDPVSFYLWRDHVVYDHMIAGAAAVCVVVVSLVSPMAANLAIAICGGYLVFWAAFKIPALSLSRFGNKDRPVIRDLSIRLADPDDHRLLVIRRPTLTPSPSVVNH
jgi:hypothetical protein